MQQAIINDVQNDRFQATFTAIQHIVAEKLILEPEEVSLESDFSEEDLDIEMTPIHKIILMRIQNSFPELGLDMENLEDCQTVGELAQMIEDERQMQAEF